MINSYAFLALPIRKKNYSVYPPTLNDSLKNPNFTQWEGLFTTSQEELEDSIHEHNPSYDGPIPTPWLFLLGSAYEDKEFENTIREAFRFFLHEEITILYENQVIILGNLEEELTKVNNAEELRIIDEEEFFNLQNTVRTSLGIAPVEKPDPDESPRIKRMKAKARLRDRVKAKKGMGLSLGDSLVSICCMGIGLTPLNIGEISYAALGKIIDRYQKKEAYETDIQSILAGADAKKIHPKYWITNE
uniref:Uncharacterized protein n=1 Tax=Siphoviridae sp. ctxjx4 TaxID=2826522 RepID=A0A8S5M297_9CAUD|nr:MAG TPA: hypothetical protein [Siphoviridae sp. ctxjx4]